MTKPQPDNQSRLGRRAALATGLLLALTACSTPLTPERKAAETARAELGVKLLLRGCIATKAQTHPSIAYFQAQGMTQPMPRISNASGVYAKDLSKGATIASFSMPGIDGRGCSVIIDDVSPPIAAGAYYAMSRARNGDETGASKPVPYGITAAGGLPRFQPDGTFEALSFESGLNLETHRPAFVLTYVTGKTTLPLRELPNGILLPSPPEIATKLQ